MLLILSRRNLLLPNASNEVIWNAGDPDGACLNSHINEKLQQPDIGRNAFGTELSGGKVWVTH